MGPAGVGKSTLAAQYVLAAADKGERAAIFTFDEGVPTLLARAAGVGLDLRPAIQAGLIEIRQVDPAELTPGEFSQAVREAVEARNARVVVIDSLNGFLHAMPEEHFLTLQLHELLTYLAQMGVITLMVVGQHGVVGPEMVSPIDVSYLADSVILFRHFEHQGRFGKAISMLKRRVGPHDTMIRELVISGKGVEVGQPLDRGHGLVAGTISRTTRVVAEAAE